MLRHVEGNEEEKFSGLSAITGLAILILGHLLYSGLFPKTIAAIAPNPIFYLERLGYILVLFYLCWIVDRKTNIKSSFIMDASRESLLIYWMHLIVIYGMFWSGRSLALIIGTKLNVWEATLATLVLITLMIFAAKIWGWLKKDYSKFSSFFAKAVIGLLLIAFFIF